MIQRVVKNGLNPKVLLNKFQKTFCIQSLNFKKGSSFTGSLYGKGCSTSVRIFSTFSSTFNQKDLKANQTTAGVKLSQLLDKELDHEVKSTNPPSPRLGSYINQSGYQLIQDEGGNLVELRRKIGRTDHITVRFSISDLNVGKIDIKESEINLFSSPDEYPIKCLVILNKAGVGSLMFDTVIADGFFGFLSVTRYNSNYLQPIKASNHPHLDHTVFNCPFRLLPEEIKAKLEDYLESVGVDDEMAIFIRNYIVFKEQNEYMRWLSELSSFLKA